ncbi:hypothetical protein PSEUDO8Z_160103 [Pseudomonas sp. 8Z]|nr:hypothetical protein PSEUDO8Z_160103 [Pseudomonas sp. 8Z]
MLILGQSVLHLQQACPERMSQKMTACTDAPSQSPLLHSAITTATLRLTFQNKSIDPP